MPLTGLPGVESGLPRVKIHDHLPAGELEKVMRTAGLVLSRAGYSTVMDLARLGKKAVLYLHLVKRNRNTWGIPGGAQDGLLYPAEGFFPGRALDAATGFPFAKMAGRMRAFDCCDKELVSRVAPAI